MGKAILYLVLILTSLPPAVSQEPISNINTIPDTAHIYRRLQKADSLASAGLGDSALIIYKQTLSLSKSIEYIKGIVYSYLKIAEQNDNSIESIAIVDLAPPYFPKLHKKDQHLIPAIQNLKGLNFSRMGMYDSAVYYYNQALSSIDSLHIYRPKFTSITFNNIGTAFINTNQLSNAIKYYHKALEVPGIDSTMRAEYYGNIGVTYANLVHDIDSALYWWHKAITIFRNLNRKDRLQFFYANISVAWQSSEHKDLAKSAQYLDSAVQVDPSTAFDQPLVLRATAILAYYKGNYLKAIEYGNHLIEISQSKSEMLSLSQAYLLLSYCYAFLGNQKLTESYLSKYQALSSKMNNESVRQTIYGLEFKYRTAEKEKALAEKERALAMAKAETYRQRNWLILAGGGFMVLGLLSVGFVRNARHRRRLDTEKITSLEQQNRLQALSIRMEAEENERIRISSELHDSLGVLISAAKLNNTLLRKNIPSEVPRVHTICTDGATILDNIHQEMRSIAHNLKPEFYLSNKGLAHALNQLIAKLQSEHFQISVSEFGPAYRLHPKRGFEVFRILEEIINNSLRHSRGSFLDIQLVYTDTHLNISSEDNGIGFDPASVKAGIGLENIRRRVDQLEGHLSLNAEKDKGSAYLIEIPY